MEKELSTKIIKIIKDYCKKEDIKNFLDYIAPFSSHKTDEIGMVFDNVSFLLYHDFAGLYSAERFVMAENGQIFR